MPDRNDVARDLEPGQVLLGVRNDSRASLANADGKYAPLSLDNVGNVLVALGALLAGEDQANNRLLTDIKPADTDSVQVTLQNAANTAITGTAINMKGYKSMTLDIQGTFTNITANFEGTLDDTNWFSVGLISVANPLAGAAVVSSGAAGQFYLPAGIALSQFRARTTIGGVTGTMTVISRRHPR